LKVQELSRYQRYEDLSRETISAILDMSGKAASRHFANHYKKSDECEPRLVDGAPLVIPEIGTALSEYAKAGLFSQSFTYDHGGMQIPLSVSAASFASFLAANVATAAYPMLTVANARLLTAFANPEIVRALAIPQIEGRYFGTMCLSESHAGSSLADIATRAVADGQDTLGQRFRIFGTKMWISGGDHGLSENICHLVLAKIVDGNGRAGPGTESISLFAVPKVLVAPGDFAGRRNDVVAVGLNHKMGYRGTVNCVLNFGEGRDHRPGGQAGAVGYLVGERGQGLRIMFKMMNEARLQVGLGAAMLAYRGHRLSVAYAAERPQGRPRGATPDTRPIPIIQHADVKRMLLAQKSYAEGAVALVLYCFHLADLAEATENEIARQLLDLLTPIAKTWSSEWGLCANDIAIQIHGGCGYTRDFDVEQLYRDNRLNAIHEGTTGIQAIDFVGRKIVRDDGRALGHLYQEIDATLDRVTASSALMPVAEALRAARHCCETFARQVISDPERMCASANATPILQAFGHLVSGWLWLDQALAAESAGGALPLEFTDGKIATACFFALSELPKISGWLEQIRKDPAFFEKLPNKIFRQ
jgi:alkylation response protein AidB-like acyl-CoA dehydrogenase